MAGSAIGSASDLLTACVASILRGAITGKPCKRLAAAHHSSIDYKDEPDLPSSTELWMSAAFDVPIIGAGMAGLTAARVLAEQGLRVVVYEARQRVGGRIFTLQPGPGAVELGAEFIHGRPPELWQLAAEADVLPQERTGDDLCFRDGKLSPCEALPNDGFQWIEALKNWNHPDCSFADYIRGTSASEATRTRLADYVEGFNAADQRVISAASLGKQQAAEDAIEGDRAFHLDGGYSRIPDFLAGAVIRAGGQIATGTLVRAIAWKPGHAELTLEHNGVVQHTHAAKVLVTIPLGTLLAGSIAFQPRPETILSAATQMRMGTVLRVVLEFREPFWTAAAPGLAHDLEDANFLFTPAQLPPVWWTTPKNPLRLTAWIGGPRVAQFPRSQPALHHALLASLGQMLQTTPEALAPLFRQSFTHDWQRDPLAMGAYSYVAVDGAHASAAMAEPVQSTLFFAGEHTDVTGHWGTVHGAMRSGLRAAAQIAQA